MSEDDKDLINNKLNNNKNTSKNDDNILILINII